MVHFYRQVIELRFPMFYFTTDKPGIVLDSCEPLLLHYVKKTELNQQISGYFQVKRAKYS